MKEIIDFCPKIYSCLMYGKKSTEKCVLNKNIKLQDYKNYFKTMQIENFMDKKSKQKNKKTIEGKIF